MKWCINQLNISYRRTILFLTSLIYNNSWSYSKQTNSQAKKQVYMCLKKYYTCQTYTLDLQKTFDIAVVYVISHISLGLLSWIHQNNIYSYSETNGDNTFVIITMLYTQRICDWQSHWQLEAWHHVVFRFSSNCSIFQPTLICAEATK